MRRRRRVASSSVRAWRFGPRIIRQAIKLALDEPRAPVDHRCLIATAPVSRLVAAGGSAIGTCTTRPLSATGSSTRRTMTGCTVRGRALSQMVSMVRRVWVASAMLRMWVGLKARAPVRCRTLWIGDRSRAGNQPERGAGQCPMRRSVFVAMQPRCANLRCTFCVSSRTSGAPLYGLSLACCETLVDADSV